MDAIGDAPAGTAHTPQAGTVGTAEPVVLPLSNSGTHPVVHFATRFQVWAQVAELLASVAVVVTLFFLIAEVRSNTRALERQIGLDGVSRVAGPLINSSDFAAIYGKVKAVDGAEPFTLALAKRYGLSLEQSVRWARYQQQLWLGLQADYHYSGRSDRLDGTIRSLLPFRDSQLFWQYEKGLFAKSFVSYVDGLRR